MALEQLYFVSDIMERYQCGSVDTARRYMRQMGAKGAPLFVKEDQILAWEDEHTTGRKPKPKTRKQNVEYPVGEMIIPRRK